MCRGDGRGKLLAVGEMPTVVWCRPGERELSQLCPFTLRRQSLLVGAVLLDLCCLVTVSCFCWRELTCFV